MDAGCWDSIGITEACEKSRASLDGLKQRFLICRKDMVASTSLPHDDDEDDRKLPAPHRLIVTYWESDQIREACEKSKAALDDLIKSISSTTDPSGDHQIRKVAKVEKLFLIHKPPEEKDHQRTAYWSYTDSLISAGGEKPWQWGSRDMMLDLGDPTFTAEQRMAILKAAANLTGGSVHLLLNLRYSLSQEEEKVWLEALSLAADRDAVPRSLLIQGGGATYSHGLLCALKKSKGLQHLSLQTMEISDECIQVLCGFTSLISLHLLGVAISHEFVVKLANLHPSHSSLAASLHRLHINHSPLNWESTGFLRHWPRLKELSLVDSIFTTETDLIDFMEHLAPAKTVLVSADNTESASPPQLYSLEFSSDFSLENFSRSATAAVVDALSRSGLPFFSIQGIQDPAIEAQLQRNQRNFIRLGLDSKRVPATSIRLFICGDPFAGKSTLVSTMALIYARRKWDKLVRCLYPSTHARTRGIEVRAIEEKGTRISLWDMAGQPEFHAFHDCMFPDIGTSSYQLPSMFMFVWSPMDSRNNEKGAMKTERSFEASLKYWLRFLASKSRQSNIALRVVVVFTRADQMNPPKVSSWLSNSVDSLRSQFQGVIDIVDPLFDVDARKMASVKAVAECVFVVASEMLQDVQMYKICTQVSDRLSMHLKTTNERIITWEKFTEICNNKAKLNAIALSLNEAGTIIYINKIKHIVLDPNWFCNEIMGSLIHFPNSKTSKGSIIFENGCIPRHFLEEKLDFVTGSKVKGSLVVDLMEAMHLCCKVDPANHGVLRNNYDLMFVPTMLTDGLGTEQLQWRLKPPPGISDDEYGFFYMGRRLECKDKNLTFLTPGLFPRIQVLFNNAFQSEEDKPNIMLCKDFISICFPNKEIIMVFCQSKSDHVIDVLVRAPTNSHKDVLSTLAYVEKHIINTLIMICAQPSGSQGVKLIESVIRPDCLCYPSRAQDREDQCVEITYLKEQLTEKLLRGEPKSYEWKWTRQTPYPLQNDFIDLLGSENYEEVLITCKAWLDREAENQLLYFNNDELNSSGGRQSQQNVTMTALEDIIVEEVIEVQYSKFMAKAIGSKINSIDHKIDRIDRKLDANHKQLLEKMDTIHQELQYLRKDDLTTVEKSIGKLLKMALNNEAEKQLPRVVILTIDGHDKNVARRMTSLLGALSVKIQLYCEHETLPHPVENQPGITLTSWSESRLESLRKALPYINIFFYVLTRAIRLGINSVAPLASSALHDDWIPHLKLVKEHSMISHIIKSEFDRSTSSKNSYICPNTQEYFKEWQKCLASILVENGGVTDQNIAEKFCLKRVKTNGGTRVAWLCKKHCEGQRPFPLS